MEKDICKNVFVNRYEKSDVIENCANFLKKMEELKSYMIKFFENGAIKPVTTEAMYNIL